MSRGRDALLALATLTLVIAISFANGAPDRRFEPLPALAGVVGALVAELFLFRYQRTTQRLWAQRRVRVGAVAGAVLVVGGAALSGLTVVGVVLAWGLVGYLALLGGIAARERVAKNR